MYILKHFFAKFSFLLIKEEAHSKKLTFLSSHMASEVSACQMKFISKEVTLEATIFETNIICQTDN